MRSLVTGCVLLTCTAVAACSHDGRVLVVVDSDLVPGPLATVRAIVRGSAGEQLRDFPVTGREGDDGDRAEHVPLSFLVVPREGGSGGNFEVVVEGHSGTSPSAATLIVSRRAVTGFIPGRTLVLPMPLLSSCAGVTCPDGQTCTENGCESSTVDPATLTEATTPGDETHRPDAGPDEPSTFDCVRWGPFSAPVEVVELNSVVRDCCPSITADELYIVFWSQRTGGTLWEATRASTSEPFGDPVPIDDAVLGGSNAEEPAISRDGLTLYYQLREGPIDHAIRTSRTAAWVAQGQVPGTMSGYIAPALTADETTLFLSTAGVRDLYVATRPDRGSPFATPVRLDEISSDAPEGYPTVSPDGLVVFFHRQIGMENFILTASRATTMDAFGPASVVTELGVRGDPEIGAAGETMWSSGFFTGAEIYHSTRGCLERAPAP